MSFVYLLTNKSMPGLVKVGMTARHPSDRATELHSTGVPTPFEVAAIWEVRPDDMKKYEKKAHKGLEKFRVSSNREFFQIEPKQAIAILSEIIPNIEQVEQARKKREEEQRQYEASLEARRKEQARLAVEQRTKAFQEYKLAAERELRRLNDQKAELVERIANYHQTFDDFLEWLFEKLMSLLHIVPCALIALMTIKVWIEPDTSMDERIKLTITFVLCSPIFYFVFLMLYTGFIGIVTKVIGSVFSSGKPTKSMLEAELKEVSAKELMIMSELEQRRKSQ